MPFKVKFRIYMPGKDAPCLETFDRQMAYNEWSARKAKNALARLVPDVTYIAGSKQDEYVWLVYRVIKAIRKYFDEKGKVTKEIEQENMRVSLALEKELDQWNTRTRFYLQGHPKSTPDNAAAFAFFEVVEAWRARWKEYFRYKKQKDKDPKWEKKLKDDCFAMEAEIKKYVRLVIGI